MSAERLTKAKGSRARRRLCSQALAIAWAMTLALSFPLTHFTSANAAEFALGVDDRMTIKIYEWPDLSGEYAVGPSGAISLPLIGDVSASGLTLEALAATIAERLQQRAALSDAPSVTVQMRQFRPFFILGDVQKPGEYPYRPGLTVLQAVGIAGGYFRFTDPGLLRLERDAIASRGDLRALTTKLDALRARRARLQSESAASETIEFPYDLVERREEPAIAGLIEDERTLHRATREALAEQIASLDRLTKLYEGEINSLKAQIETERRQRDLVQKELADVQNLVSRGLAPTPRLLLLERTIAQIQGQQQSLETLILRARQSINQNELKIHELRAKDRERVNVDTLKTEADLAETRVRIDTARRLIYEAEVTAPLIAGERLNDTKTPSRFYVSQRDGQALNERAVEPTDPVRPGDVITVRRLTPESTPVAAAPSADPSTDGRAATPLSRESGVRLANPSAPAAADGRGVTR